MTQETEGLKLWREACHIYGGASIQGTCGEARAAAIIDAALAERDAEIARLRPYVDAFRREESRADRLAQTVEDQAKQIEALREAHWFYLGDECSSDLCRFDISECISEDFEWDNEPKGQHILQISGARQVPDMWVALHYYTDEEKDERGDDEPYTYSVHASEAEARAALGSAKP